MLLLCLKLFIGSYGSEHKALISPVKEFGLWPWPLFTDLVLSLTALCMCDYLLHPYWVSSTSFLCSTLAYLPVSLCTVLSSLWNFPFPLFHLILDQTLLPFKVSAWCFLGRFTLPSFGVGQMPFHVQWKLPIIFLLNVVLGPLYCKHQFHCRYPPGWV